MDGWPIQGTLRGNGLAEARTAAAEGPAEAPCRMKAPDHLKALARRLNRAGRQPHRRSEALTGRAAS
eukprot:9247269-Alexandrium_andersonii.AAC.1